MRMRANDHVGTRVNDAVRNILLLVIQYGGVFIAAVQINNREVVCLCGSGDITIEHEMACCQHSAVRGFGAVNRGDGDETNLLPFSAVMTVYGGTSGCVSSGIAPAWVRPMLSKNARELSYPALP